MLQPERESVFDWEEYHWFKQVWPNSVNDEIPLHFTVRTCLFYLCRCIYLFTCIQYLFNSLFLLNSRTEQRLVLVSYRSTSI